jgi:hypothetical protein
VQSSSLEMPPFFGATAEDQVTAARFFGDHMVELHCEIDGVPVPEIWNYRITSHQIRFEAPTPWVFGELGGHGTAVEDGYFLLIRPLNSGTHVLHFSGAYVFRKLPDTTFLPQPSGNSSDAFDLYAPVDVTYHLTVE